MSEITRQQLLDWDRAGFFPQDGETPADFACRVTGHITKLEEMTAALRRGETVKHLNLEFRASQLIAPEISAEAAELTSRTFGFVHTGALGIFADVGGWLWGGCMIAEPENPPPLFLLRRVFARKRRWLCYRREELLAHELCHAVRQSLGDDDLEEYFAYRTSFSGFRRWCGDLFNSAWESVAFTLLALAMPVAQALKLVWSGFPAGIFPLILAAYLAVLALRTLGRHRLVDRARRRLRAWGIAEEMALLFRLTEREIRELCREKDLATYRAIVATRSEKSLRWQIIGYRFF